MIEIKDLSVSLGNFLMKDITFDVQDGEYFVLLGPSGAGKTVLLESIAGLKPLNCGQIKINGRDVTDLNLEKRNIGFAYQDYVLYRHLSIRDNIAYGLMWKHKKRQELEEAVDRVVELLKIGYLLDRRALSLSGGESQKIGLARALAIKPDLLLLDEPLSAIDPETKEIFEGDLKAIHNRLRLTTIHVTHSFEEAMALGDRIAVIGDGRIVQIGTPNEIFRHPNSEFVARFVRTRNIFTSEVIDSAGGQSVFWIEGIKLAVDTTLRGKVHASIRPENILISREPLYPNNVNSFQGIITRIADRGSVAYLTIKVPPEFTCLILHPALEEMGLKEQQKIFISFKASDVNVF
ncbi:MAG: ABC transporter ATP-binding protein [Dehalococcoidales bacterium]|nr:ABC transporter ATP-binding protein [Dehalococcoidales bacterium]